MGDGELKDWGLRPKKPHPGLIYFGPVCHFCQKWPTGMATCGSNEVVILWGKAPQSRFRGRIRNKTSYWGYRLKGEVFVNVKDGW